MGSDCNVHIDIHKRILKEGIYDSANNYKYEDAIKVSVAIN